MQPVDFLILAAITAIIGLAIFYIVRSKKSGRKCIGCPDSKHCSGNCAECQTHIKREGQ